MRAIAIHDFTVWSGNAKSTRGSRLRRDRKVMKGESFEVVEFFRATGMATHGSRCVRVKGRDGNILSAFENNFTYEQAL